jgi:hypothetical protein
VVVHLICSRSWWDFLHEQHSVQPHPAIQFKSHSNVSSSEERAVQEVHSGAFNCAFSDIGALLKTISRRSAEDKSPVELVFPSDFSTWRRKQIHGMVQRGLKGRCVLTDCQ